MIALKIETDKRGREWELFCDASYYDLFCIKPIHIKKFNSELSFHFMHQADAEKFFELIIKAR